MPNTRMKPLGSFLNTGAGCQNHRDGLIELERFKISDNYKRPGRRIWCSEQPPCRAKQPVIFHPARVDSVQYHLNIEMESKLPVKKGQSFGLPGVELCVILRDSRTR